MNIINFKLRKGAAIVATAALLALSWGAVPALAVAPTTPVITTVTQATSTNPIILTGTADANMSIQVTGGASTSTASSTAAGTWAISVNLTAGALNQLAVAAFNTDGEFSGTATVNITHDATPPSAPVVTFPTLPHATSTTPITVSGTAEANSSITVTGGSSTATTTASGSGNWSVSVGLNPNTANTLLFVATDASANASASTSIVITHDNIAPVITLNGEATTAVFNTNGFTDPGFSVTDNLDTNIATSTSGTVNLEVAGSNTITYTATDDAGNTATSTRTVNVMIASSGGGGGGGGGASFTVITPVTANVLPPGPPIETPPVQFIANPGGFIPPGQIVQGAQIGGQVLGVTTFQFVNNLRVSSRGPEVAELQSRLAASGYFRGPITGYFGAITRASVQAFQRANGLPSTGFFGPLTRALLNS